MRQYADYNFYISKYQGEMDKQTFDRHVTSATAHVRRITFGRADQHAKDIAVKMAVCAVCDCLWESRESRINHGGMAVASENNDGYAISYVQEQKAGETFQSLLNRKINEVAELYLGSTGLLYLGVDGYAD